jgi:hypothetical protein
MGSIPEQSSVARGMKRKNAYEYGRAGWISVILRHVIMSEEVILKHDVFILFLETLISESIYLM